MRSRKNRRALKRTARSKRERAACRPRLETLEPRVVLSTTEALVVGAVFVEEDLGSDQQGDRFEITFLGGAADTELTRVMLSGDRNLPGFGAGDVFFDSESTGLGADHAFPFTIETLAAADPRATVEATVIDGQTDLALDFSHFRAGDRVVFYLDVDEVQEYDPTETDLAVVNEGFDPITSGVEFQGSQFHAFFSAPHYEDAEATGEFRNRYDAMLDGTGLDLPRDDDRGQRDRSTGVVADTVQRIKPVSLSGFVYHDRSLDGNRDAQEEGIEGVRLTVIPVETVEPQSPVQVTTDDDGLYEALDLMPGEYEVVEQQPLGYLDGLEAPGSVDGAVVGQVGEQGDALVGIRLPGGSAGIHYNFGEILPSSVSGSVGLGGPHGECDPDHQDSALEGVLVELLADDGRLLRETRSDAAGRFSFEELPPGTYALRETTPEHLFDGTDRVGSVNEEPRGRVDANDLISSILLGSDEHATGYHFCEQLPASLEGHVYHDANNDGRRQPDEQPIPGVEVLLHDAQGIEVARSVTGPEGRYAFTGLAAGTYGIREVQPNGWLDGGDQAGSVDGIATGSVNDDRINDVVLAWGSRGLDYDFGELLAGSIAGSVHTDLDGDCLFDPGESFLPGVAVELLDDGGRVLASTETDAQGRYRFTNLAPGEYAVRQMQPEGFFHGGQRAGSQGGDDGDADLISAIHVGSGEHLDDYNFCETPPASLAGLVHLDLDGDCIQDAGEAGVSGVRIQLLDEQGRVVAETLTRSDGRYAFESLRPGRYGIRELQPEGLFDGGQRAGTAGALAESDDLFTGIVLLAGMVADDYNFCEHPPASIAGTVFASPNADCEPGDHASGIPGTRIELLDGDGRIAATTVTDGDGRYAFQDLATGHYAVREIQPEQWLPGGQHAGSGGGDTSTADLIGDIIVSPGADLIGYDFCEIEPAILSGYVFQDGPAIRTVDGTPPANVLELRDGRRTPDDRPLAGVVLELRNGLDGTPVHAHQALEGVYPDGPIRTTTDAAGYYEFRGLAPGSYAVYQVQPVEEGLHDGIDTAGTTSGLAINPQANISPFILSRLTLDPNNDAIILIPVSAGAVSAENNFSEIRVQRETPFSPPVRIEPPPRVVTPPIQFSDVPWTFGTPAGPLSTPVYGGGFGAAASSRTWHLSVIDAGMPRGGIVGRSPDGHVWHMTSYNRVAADWSEHDLSLGEWQVAPSGRDPEAAGVQRRFGRPGAIPIAGDFNGDGVTEVGVFLDGEWFLDLNGNGIWDEEDLWAQLGSLGDLPVVGDWDGDGKDDIGIFGPEWAGDDQAIAQEPGLPDLDNPEAGKPKNVPPRKDEATYGMRLMQRTAEGDGRADVIDHVFRFGGARDIPVAGDWNGDGVDSIGIFRSGIWILDSDSNGRMTSRDEVVHFGREGDVPVVGDFNGDGVDEIGVVRNDQWTVDADGNRRDSEPDQRFRWGDDQSYPVVGDFDGDGRDDPASYR